MEEERQPGQYNDEHYWNYDTEGIIVNVTFGQEVIVPNITNLTYHTEI